eukprot:834033-Amphidinium_carterae.1
MPCETSKGPKTQKRHFPTVLGFWGFPYEVSLLRKQQCLYTKKVSKVTGQSSTLPDPGCHIQAEERANG